MQWFRLSNIIPAEMCGQARRLGHPIPGAIAIAVSLLTAACNKLPEPTTTTAPMPETPAAAGGIPDVDVIEHVKMALLQSEPFQGADTVNNELTIQQ